MTFTTIIALALAMLLLALIPGPGVMATVARALSSGLKPAMSLIGGIVAGDLIFLLLAIYGLSQIAELLGTFFVIVKLFGGAYLIWIGIRLLRSRRKPMSMEDRAPQSARASDFFSGLAITLGNPKVIVFYLSFLPTFLDLSALTGFDIVVVATVVSSILGGVMLVYALAAARARSLISNDRFTKRVDQTAGAILIGSGSLLIAKAQ